MNEQAPEGIERFDERILERGSVVRPVSQHAQREPQAGLLVCPDQGFVEPGIAGFTLSDELSLDLRSQTGSSSGSLVGVRQPHAISSLRGVACKDSLQEPPFSLAF